MQTHFAHLQQTAFENIETKGEIAHNQQFSIHGDFPKFCLDIFKVVCCRFAVYGKALRLRNMPH